jgi:hypothetical protein
MDLPLANVPTENEETVRSNSGFAIRSPLRLSIWVLVLKLRQCQSTLIFGHGCTFLKITITKSQM